MNIVQTINIPSPPSVNLGFYEHTFPECILSSPENARQADIDLGNYDDLEWNSIAAPSVLEDATTWGTKTLPGAGAFFFANHEDGDPTLGHIDRVGV